MIRLWSWQALVVALLVLMVLWTVTIHDVEEQRPIVEIELDQPDDEWPSPYGLVYCQGWASSFCTALGDTETESSQR